MAIIRGNKDWGNACEARNPVEMDTPMKPRQKLSGNQRSFLLPSLAEQCDPRHPLTQLARKMPWGIFEEAFADYYSEEGRPAKPVRLMVGSCYSIRCIRRVTRAL